MGLNEHASPRLPHAAPQGGEAPPAHDTVRMPDELPNWESVWIDLGGEG